VLTLRSFLGGGLGATPLGIWEMNRNKFSYYIILITFLACNCVYSQFDHSRYKKNDLDSLIIITPKAKKEMNDSNTKAFDICRAEKYQFDVMLSDYPIPMDTCKNRERNVYERLLKSLGSNDKVSINHIMRVKTKSGRVFVVLVQDTLVDYIYSEIKETNLFTIYCLHYYNDEDGPGLLVNEFNLME